MDIADLLEYAHYDCCFDIYNVDFDYYVAKTYSFEQMQQWIEDSKYELVSFEPIQRDNLFGIQFNVQNVYTKKMALGEVVEDLTRLKEIIEPMSYEECLSTFKKANLYYDGFQCDITNICDGCFDLNFGSCGCFTIINNHGKAKVAEKSIEIWNGDICYGTYELKEILQELKEK